MVGKKSNPKKLKTSLSETLTMETPLITLQRSNSPQHLESYYFACLTLICKLLSSKCTQTWGKLEALHCPQHPKRSHLAGITSKAIGCGTARPRTASCPHPCAAARGGVKRRCPRILGLKGARRGERDVRDSHSEVRALSPPSLRTRARSPCRVMCRLGARIAPAAAPLGPVPRSSPGCPGESPLSRSPGCPVEAGSRKGAREKRRAFIYTGSAAANTPPPPPRGRAGIAVFISATGGRRAVD